MAKKHKLSDKVIVELGKPVVLAVSRVGEKRWGFHQFPALSRLPDGRIFCMFSYQTDAVVSYGNPARTYVSSDDGVTWKLTRDEGPIRGAPHSVICSLFDGEFLCVPPMPAFDLKAAKLTMPEPVGQFRAYADNLYYRLADCPKKLRDHFTALPALRWTPKTRGWRKEKVAYDTRGALVTTRAKGRERFLAPTTWFEHPLLRVGRELLYADYRANYLLADGSVPKHCTTVLMVSADNGRTFQRRATIAHDPEGKDLMGEPRLAANALGELVCVIRRAHHVQKPMAITFSKDGGRTWEKPRKLHEFGVFPDLALLDCGVMALSFGRPGVHLSFSLNGTGRAWTEPISVRPGGTGHVMKQTCGYTSILMLDADSFLLAYSDFEHRRADGRQRKAILVRKVTVHIK